MTATIVPLVDQILACNFEDRKFAFLKLAEQMLKQEPLDRPIPLTDEKGECYGVYWPKFISNRITPPTLPPVEHEELLRRHANLVLK